MAVAAARQGDWAGVAHLESVVREQVSALKPTHEPAPACPQARQARLEALKALLRLDAAGAPRGVLSRSALALLLGEEEDAPVPATVDLAPGAGGRLHVLLEDGSVYAVRPF